MLNEMKNDRSECRWPLTARPPHFFCGEAVAQPPYCDRCRALHKPFTGKRGKDWQALAGMIDATEQTVMHHTPRPEPGPQALDDVLRDAADVYDEPGGLMRRV